MNLANLFYNTLNKVDKRMAKIIFNTLLLIALISTFAIYKFLISLPDNLHCQLANVQQGLLKSCYLKQILMPELKCIIGLTLQENTLSMSLLKKWTRCGRKAAKKIDKHCRAKWLSCLHLTECSSSVHC